jgi:ATP/maltotriose-dependent transcriptional regulator MalT
MKVDLEANPAQYTDDVRYRMDRLEGVLQWRIKLDYDARLTTAYKHLQELDAEIDDMNKHYRSFVRTRQAATQSYEGYTIPIQQSRTRLKTAQLKLRGVMARQGRVLEQLAIDELDRRRQRLEEYQVKARFALAESYDRATKAQEKEELEAIEAKAKAEQLKHMQENPVPTAPAAEPEPVTAPDTAAPPVRAPAPVSVPAPEPADAETAQ